MKIPKPERIKGVKPVSKTVSDAFSKLARRHTQKLLDDQKKRKRNEKLAEARRVREGKMSVRTYFEKTIRARIGAAEREIRTRRKNLRILKLQSSSTIVFKVRIFYGHMNVSLDPGFRELYHVGRGDVSLAIPEAVKKFRKKFPTTASSFLKMSVFVKIGRDWVRIPHTVGQKLSIDGQVSYKNEEAF